MSIVWPIGLLESSIQKGTALFRSSHFSFIDFVVCFNSEKQCIQTAMDGPKLWIILKLSSPFSDLSYLKKNLNLVSDVDFSRVGMPHQYRISLLSDEAIMHKICID